MPLKDPVKRKEYEKLYRKKRDYKAYNKMRYERDREKILEYNRQWRLAHPEKLKLSRQKSQRKLQPRQKKHRQELKIALIQKKGGKCEICGWTGHFSAFDFHHKDPTTREWKDGRGGEWRLTKYRLDANLDDLQLLCANCHRILHHKE